jgi:hypothetical protein
MTGRVQRSGRFDTADSIGREPPETGFRRLFLMGNPGHPRARPGGNTQEWDRPKTAQEAILSQLHPSSKNFKKNEFFP